MAFLSGFLISNFMTLMILLYLMVIIIVNRKLAVPATGYFSAGIITLLLLTITDFIKTWIEQDQIFIENPDKKFRVLVAMTVLSYILRPLIIMILSFIVIPNNRVKLPCILPALINTAVYIFAGFGKTAAFLLDKDSPWHHSIIGMTLLYTELFYLFLLMLSSILYFKRDELKRSIIVLLTVIQLVLVSVLERLGILTGYGNTVLALGILEYYSYLSVIYQHEMQEAIIQKELDIAQHKMAILRSQIHPHFIVNALSIIRSLIKKDTEKAIECVDYFSDYLNIHISTVQLDSLIYFKQELRHVEAYLSLVQADSSKQIDVRYDLTVTDFKLPPLTLEPLIENAVKYGTGKTNGVIIISTDETEHSILICVADNGTGEREPESSQKTSGTGIGISNTRERLAMQCGGRLVTDQTKSGMTATIILPKTAGETAEV